MTSLDFLYLKKHRFDKWVQKKIISKKDLDKIENYFFKYGNWRGLAFATQLKNKNKPQKKYKYVWINIKKKECLLMNYMTSGSFSWQKRKRHRMWYNIYFTQTGESRIKLLQKQYPDYEIFHIKHSNYRIGLRKPIQ